MKTGPVPGVRFANDVDRFLYWVTVTPGCWLWRGRLVRGYGRFSVKKQQFRAHRWSYEQWKGPIPEGLVIDHLCRNRGCVNPDHLEVVTVQENLARGEGFNAINAAKTHCPQGHPYDEVNTEFRNGRRYCRECGRVHWRDWYNRTRKVGASDGTSPLRRL